MNIFKVFLVMLIALPAFAQEKPSIGFEELVLPLFVEESDVYKEYGPEAALILDRLYYLAVLPRPDIGVSQEKIKMIQSIVPNFDNVDGLKKIFRRYKKGEIDFISPRKWAVEVKWAEFASNLSKNYLNLSLLNKKVWTKNNFFM